jgi:FAD/FMN-containing dehydrogenase
LFKPGDAGWDAARQAWNLIADQHPDAVVVVSGTDDVAAAVTFARENGLGVVAQGTGHGAPALESLEGVLLVKTQQLSDVEIDPRGPAGPGRGRRPHARPRQRSAGAPA